MGIKVGDFVGFKCDIEQYAEVIEVREGRDWMGRPSTSYVVKAPPDGFAGQYIGRSDTHVLEASDIFDEED